MKTLEEVTKNDEFGQCPRCGNHSLNVTRPALNALARRVKHSDGSSVEICSPCGTEEAFEDMGMIEPKKWKKEIK